MLMQETKAMSFKLPRRKDQQDWPTTLKSLTERLLMSQLEKVGLR
jgi:hypothetical protein